MKPAIRPAAEILSSLDTRQIGELDRNLAEEKNKQRREERDLGPDAYLDKRANKTLDFLEGLTGKLSREQRQKVRDIAGACHWSRTFTSPSAKPTSAG